MGQLTSDELALLREVFNKFDSDKNGRIDRQEFVGLVGELSADMTAEDAIKGFERIDSDHNGTIEFGEFADWWAGVDDNDSQEIQ